MKKNKKLGFEELKIAVFENNQADKRNKDRLFKLAKVNDDIETIERLRDEFGFKGARIYLDKLANSSLDDVIQNRDTRFLQKLIDKGSDLSKINTDNLIEKKYDDTFLEILIKKGLYVNVANLVKNRYKKETIELSLVKGARVNETYKYLTALAYASQHNQKEIVELLLKFGGKIDIGFTHGHTALTLAILNDENKENIEIIRLLLENGADINKKLFNGWTPLIIASDRDNKNVVKLLLDYGADINLQSGNKGTALILSVVKSNVEVVKILLEYGADIDVIEITGATALDIARTNRNQEIINLLVSVNAQESTDEFPPLFQAFMNHDIEKIEELLNLGQDVNQIYKSNGTVLMLLSGMGDIQGVKLSLEYGANINLKSEQGLTALTMASFYGQDKIVQLLLEYDAKKEMKGYGGMTALDIAKENKYLKIVKLLEVSESPINKNPSNINMKERVEKDLKEVVLNKFIEVGKEESTKYFEKIDSTEKMQQEINNLERDSIPFIERSLKRISLTNEEMYSSILIKSVGDYGGIYIHKNLAGIKFQAIKTNKGYFIDFPLYRTINPLTKEAFPIGHNWEEEFSNIFDNNSPIFFLSYLGHMFLKYRKEKDNIYSKSLYSMKDNNYILIKKLENFDYLSQSLYEELYLLAKKEACKKSIIKIKNLLEKNIDINKLNADGKTALMIASENNNLEVVKILLELNVDINIQDKEGFTALMLASGKGYSKMVLMLLDNGAILEVENYRGQDAMLFATRNMYPKIIELLEEHGAEIKGTYSLNVDTFEKNEAKNLITFIEDNLNTKDLIIEFLLYSLHFDYVYELNLDYYIENNSSYTVMFRIGRDEKFKKKVVNVYNKLHKEYIDPLNINDKSKNNIRNKFYDLLMEKYELGKYENSRFSEPLFVESNDYLLYVLSIKEENYNAKIYIYNNYLTLNIHDKKIYSFTYTKEENNLYVNHDRGEIIISKTKVIEKDRKGGQRVSKFTREENEVSIKDKFTHTPKALSTLLTKFSSDEKLKYSNHTWDSSLAYSDFMKNLKEEFEKIEDDLKILSPNLYQDIQKFLFLEDNEKTITWSSKIIKDEINEGILPHNISLDTTNQPFKTFGDAIDNFKSLFVVKQNDKKLKLLKKFTKIKKELGLKNIDLNDLKKDKIDKFFTDTKQFEKALTLILKDIQENSNDDKKDIVIEADTIFVNGMDMIEIKIIHIGSTAPKTAEALKETINKNGGNFQTIHDNLLSVCDWSIDTICQDEKRYRIDYLYPEINNSKPHCIQIDDESRGFTHILRFYI